jgi:hypothetical protein
MQEARQEKKKKVLSQVEKVCKSMVNARGKITEIHSCVQYQWQNTHLVLLCYCLLVRKQFQKLKI